ALQYLTAAEIQPQIDDRSDQQCQHYQQTDQRTDHRTVTKHDIETNGDQHDRPQVLHQRPDVDGQQVKVAQQEHDAQADHDRRADQPFAFEDACNPDGDQDQRPQPDDQPPEIGLDYPQIVEQDEHTQNNQQQRAHQAAAAAWGTTRNFINWAAF